MDWFTDVDKLTTLILVCVLIVAAGEFTFVCFAFAHKRRHPHQATLPANADRGVLPVPEVQEDLGDSLGSSRTA